MLNVFQLVYVFRWKVVLNGAADDDVHVLRGRSSILRTRLQQTVRPTSDDLALWIGHIHGESLVDSLVDTLLPIEGCPVRFAEGPDDAPDVLALGLGDGRRSPVPGLARDVVVEFQPVAVQSGGCPEDRRRIQDVDPLLKKIASEGEILEGSGRHFPKQRDPRRVQ